MRAERPVSRLSYAFWLTLVPGAVLTLLISELLNPLNPDVWLPPANLAVALLFILSMELFFVGIFRRVSRAVLVTQLLITLFSVVNYLKQYFRGDPFFAGDITMAGSIDSFAGDLRYRLEPRALVAILVLLVTAILATRTRRRIEQPLNRVLISVAALTMTTILTVGVLWNDTVRRDWIGMQDYAWNAMANTRENGFLIPFLRSTADLLPPGKPSLTVGKSDYQVDKTAASPAPGQPSATLASRPNVIVLMSEAFSDLEHIRSLRTSEPVMPFYRQLQADKNTIDGSLLVSIFVGSTSSTEFEFLTGSSMYFVNDGVVPYMRWFKRPTHGLADLFNQQGYRSVAIHPFLASYYDRDTVFPNLGFSDYISMERFPSDARRIRGNISDAEHVAQVIRTFEQKKPEERLFLFTVSMQNHFPYDRAEAGLAELTYHVRLTDMTQIDSVELYLSLLRQSDDALKQLVAYFEKTAEPTLIVVFGDHLPGLSDGFRPFYQDFIGKDFSELNLAETRRMYETPFLIWANYPLPEDRIDITSPNFLSATVAELAGASLSPYYRFVRDLNANLTAISNKILVLKDGTTVDRDHVPTELSYELEQYWSYQYENVVRESD